MQAQLKRTQTLHDCRTQDGNAGVSYKRCKVNCAITVVVPVRMLLNHLNNPVRAVTRTTNTR
ncbi:hypothetical protein BDI4_620026 [Burkholderia diffusa]|nr:hypothetical protein BDI4_620026 [Burkholderia diffusa]